MQGIQNASPLSAPKAEGKSTSTAQQTGSLQGSNVTRVAGQLLPENNEEVGMFRGFFKSLGKRKTTTTKEFGANHSRQLQQVSKAKEIADSAEEQGMMVSKLKNKGEVGKLTGTQAKSDSEHPKAEKLDKLFQKVKDLDRKKIANAIQEVLIAPQGDPAESLKAITSKSKDVTHQYLGMLELKQQLQENIEKLSKVKGGDSETLSYYSKLNVLVNDKLHELADEDGSKIRAGLNMTEVAMMHAMGKSAAVTELRDFYRDYVMNYAALFQAYKKILKRFKKGGFKKGKKFLMEALIADMGSEGSSISEERLGAIMKDMQALRSIERLHDESDKLFNRLSRKYRVKDDKRLPMTEAVLSFFDGSNFRTAIKKKVAMVVKTLSISHLEGNINLLHGVREILSSVPPALFKTANERSQIIQTVQAELDNYINKESDSSEFSYKKTKL